VITYQQSWVRVKGSKLGEVGNSLVRRKVAPKSGGKESANSSASRAARKYLLAYLESPYNSA